MKHKNIAIRIVISVLASFVLIFGMVGTSAAGPAPVGQEKAGGVRMGTHPVTGMLAFVGAEPSAPISVAGAVGEGIPAQTRAQSILAVYAPQFGVQNPAEELTVLREKESDGRQIIRYQQVYQGVPVLGGELILNMNDGGLISMSGEASPFLSVPTEPVISAAQARETALALVAKHYNLKASQLTTSEPALWIYDQRLLEGTSVQSPHIVWRVEVRAGGLPVRELVLVNALKGNISLNFNQVDTVWGTGPVGGSGTSEMSAAPASVQPVPQSALGTPTLSTYDSLGTGNQQFNPVCIGSHVRACSSGDAANAHGYAYDTYFAFSQAPFNRDSIDGAGMTLISNVNWNNGTDCPNAFWDGSQMTYCTGLAADDVVGHELTHGVTEREASLFYFWESGAINESLSDVWGEYVDQTNGFGTDTLAMKWKMGEDATGIGIIRDMKTPPLYGQPDSMSSVYYCETGNCYYYDNGGVHTNSGVNNKAAYLMVDGGVFNAKTVTLLGWTKTLVIYYEAQTNLLASGAGYFDLYHALYQACVNKVGTSGIVLADCQEVRDATDAVKMNLEPALNYNPNTDACPSGNTPYISVFNAGFETGTAGWTLGNTGGVTRWSLWTNSDWFANGWGPYAHSGLDSLYGDDGTTYNNTWAVSPAISLPAGTKPYLHFAHAYGFEFAGASYYDGGVLEYTTNGGLTWTNASTLYSGGQNMKGNIGSLYGNPLGGKKGFVSDSHGYVQSRFNLTTLAGQTVQFRWSLGTDNISAYWGWVIDDVQVNTCVGIPSVPLLSSPALNALVTDYTPTFNWSDSTGDIDHYRFQLDDNSDFSSTIYNASPVYTSDVTLGSDLDANTKYYWRVRSENAAGGASAWTVSRYFRTALPPPNSTEPGYVFPVPGVEQPLLTRHPTYIWDAVTGATGYTIQVSKNSTFTLLAATYTIRTATSQYTHTLDLAANTSYFWRVKANGANGPSLYSQVRMFRTANPPSVPLLTAPANNALMTTVTPALDWAPSTIPAGGAALSYYEVQVDNDPAFGSLDYNAGVGGDHDVISTPLAPGAKYYWRVRALNVNSEYSAWSLVRYFRVAYATPTLTLPTDAATGVALKPTYTWNPIAGATSYTLQVSKNITFTLLVVNKTIYAPTTTYIHTLNLLPNTTYYWRVRANGAYGPSLWQSPVFSFTTTP